jgi:hypothetical protein
LLAFDGNIINDHQIGLLFSLQDYLILVDTTERIQRENKRGAIADNLPPILTRLAINIDDWLEDTQDFERVYQRKFSRRSRKKRAA